MNKEKQPYEAPALTVVSFKTERGYAASTPHALKFDIFEFGASDEGTNNNVLYDYDNENDTW